MKKESREHWIHKFWIVTLSLIFSGALNIGLVAALFIRSHRDQQQAFAYSPLSSICSSEQSTQNGTLLKSYAHLSFRELAALLTNTDDAEEGYKKRDLALAALVGFHHFNLEGALGNIPLQRRQIAITLRDVEQRLEIFPSLSDEQFQAIIRFAYLEKWPLTAEGLFALLKQHRESADPALIETLIGSPEFYALQILFQKSGIVIDHHRLIALASEGNWSLLNGLLREQTQMLDLSSDRRRRFLLSYLAHQSPTAAEILVETDFQFVLKQFDDKGILDILAHLPKTHSLGLKLCVALLQSPRSDVVWVASAQKLYTAAQEEFPHPFCRDMALSRFASQTDIERVSCQNEIPPPPQPEAFGRVHVVKEGENLWKISRLYQVQLNDLISLNELEKDRIRPGMVLQIPPSTLR